MFTLHKACYTIVCYKSEHKMNDASPYKFIQNIYEAALERIRIHMQQQTVFELLKGGQP